MEVWRDSIPALKYSYAYVPTCAVQYARFSVVPKICEGDTTGSEDCGTNSAKYNQYKLSKISDNTSKLTI